MSNDKGLRSIADTRGEMLRIDPRKLKIETGWNQREEGAELDAHIDQLAQSIAEVGVRNPLKVVWKDGEAYVRSGHCRLRAAIKAIDVYKADLKNVPVIAEERYADEATQMLGQIIDNDGKPLSAFETAKIYKKLVDLGWQHQDIAKKCGKSASHVSQTLDLLLLPKDVKALVNEGKVSTTLAIQTFKANDESSVKTVKQLNQAVETAKSDGRTKAKPSDVNGTGKPSGNIRSIVKNAFEGCQVLSKSGEDGIVIIRMSVEDFNEIQASLGIGIEVTNVD